jgi:hypothetical protein
MTSCSRRWAPVRDHRIGVRNRSEALSAFNRNTCPPSSESAPDQLRRRERYRPNLSPEGVKNGTPIEGQNGSRLTAVEPERTRMPGIPRSNFGRQGGRDHQRHKNSLQRDAALTWIPSRAVGCAPSGYALNSLLISADLRQSRRNREEQVCLHLMKATRTTPVYLD